MIDIVSAIWLIVTALFLLLAMLVGNIIITKANGNVLLGVTLPYEALQDEAVARIIKKFRKASYLVLLQFLLLSFPVVFISGLISISLLYFFLWFSALLYVSQKTVKKYRDELYSKKKEKQWWVGTRNIVSIDTEVSRLKNTFPVSKIWFVIPFVISTAPIVGSLFAESRKIPWLSIFGIIMVLLLFSIYVVYCRARIIAYGDNTDINAALNRVHIREWTRCMVIFATVTSIFFSILECLPMDTNSASETGTLIVVVIFTNIFILLPIVYAYSKVRNTRNKFLRLTNEEVYTDDDEYWVFGAMFYNNPNDNRMMVERRVGGFGFTFNIAKTGAKIVCIIIFVAIVASMMWTIIYTMPLDFGSVSLSIDGQTAIVQSPLGEHSFLTNDIVSIATINELPNMTRLSGGNAPRFYSGRFLVSGYGMSYVYVHRNNPPYIVIELESGFVFLNGNTTEQTEQFFKDLNNIDFYAARDLCAHADDGIETSTMFHSSYDPEVALEIKERYCHICLALNSLPTIQGRRIAAHYIHCKSQAEIAEIEGVSKGSVSLSITRGLATLKIILRNLENQSNFCPTFIVTPVYRDDKGETIFDILLKLMKADAAHK